MRLYALVVDYIVHTVSLDVRSSKPACQKQSRYRTTKSRPHSPQTSPRSWCPRWNYPPFCSNQPLNTRCLTRYPNSQTHPFAFKRFSFNPNVLPVAYEIGRIILEIEKTSWKRRWYEI